MHILEITIQRQTENRWPVVIEHRTPNNLLVYRNGDLQLDYKRLLAQLLPHDYGQALGEALFHGAVRDTFTQALHQAGDDYLRILLHVESEQLRPLRWERLCAPFATGWDMLLLNQRTLFAHYLPSLTERRFRPFGRRDLRALVLVASPEGLNKYRMAHFDAPATARRIQGALGEIPCDLLVNDMPEAVGPATLKALAHQLTAKRYTLVHFVAHGQFNKTNGDTALFLADAQNQIDRVDSEEMLAQLRSLNPEYGFPHFAFLGTCDSAAPEAENAMGGLAQRLVRELGMPAVLAMTEQVSITTLEVLTTEFYQRLRQHGEADRALVEATTTIDTPHHDITVPALYTRLEGRPLFSDDLNRPLTETDIHHGLERMAKLMEERAPILLPRFNQLAQEAKLDPVDDLKLAPISQLCQDTLDISFPALALDSRLPAYDPRCPFQGLAAFNTKDKDFFFGRDELVEELVQRLQSHPFLAISGPSGSGKSSLILAGVVPALQEQTEEFTCLAMTPGTTPWQTLENLLAQNANPDILFIDQFEELFTLSTDAEERGAFVQRLLSLSKQTDGPTLILALRDDFWADCQAYPELYALMEEHRRQIEPMPANLLRTAMEQQASVVGLRFEAGLSNMLLDDVADEPGAMPLLQHGLKELWQHRHGRWLRVSEYEEIGGVQQAIARTAERIYNGCTSSEKALMENVMLRLVRLEEDTPADAQPRDTRRRALRSELTPLGGDKAATRSLVARLAGESLVVTKQNPATGQDEVEIAHEALIGYWGRLRDWLRTDRERLVLRQRLSNAARRWHESGRDRSLLYRGQALREARGLAQRKPEMINEDESHFLRWSYGWQWLGWLAPVAAIGVAIMMVLWYTESGPFAEPPIVVTQEVPEYVMSFAWDETSEAVYAAQRHKLAGEEEMGRLSYRAWGEQNWSALGLPGNPIREIIPTAPPSDTFYAFVEGANPVQFSVKDGELVTIEVRVPVTATIGMAAAPDDTLYIGDYAKPGVYMCRQQDCLDNDWERIDKGMTSGVHFMRWMDGNQMLLVGTATQIWARSQRGDWLSRDVGSHVVTATAYENLIFAGGLDGGIHIFSLGKEKESCNLIPHLEITSITKSTHAGPPVIVAGTDGGDLVVLRADSEQRCELGNIQEIPFDVNEKYITQINFEPHPPNKLWVSTTEGLYSGKTQEWIENYANK